MLAIGAALHVVAVGQVRESLRGSHTIEESMTPVGADVTLSRGDRLSATCQQHLEAIPGLDRAGDRSLGRMRA